MERQISGFPAETRVVSRKPPAPQSRHDSGFCESVAERATATECGK